MKLTINEIRQMQGLPLDLKIKKSQLRIREFYNHFDGDVIVAFSGGKDSTVMLDLVRKLYPDVPAIFNDTGLEYPEVREFVKTIDNVITVKPEMNFKKVLETYGYPVVSKTTANQLRALQKRKYCIDNNLPVTNEKTCNMYLSGYTSKGVKMKGHSIPEKWKYLVDAPFKISEQCCNIMKKNPAHKYCKKHNLHSYVGTMACDSEQRKMVYARLGCNSYKGNINSRPLSFWMQKDIWDYIHKYQLPYSKIYDMGYRNTGCMFCMFGAHMSKPNRFQIMEHTHPQLYKYCMEKLGLKDILHYMKIPYHGLPIKLEKFL